MRLTIAVAAMAVSMPAWAAPQATPTEVAAELTAADSAYSERSASTDAASGISAMFARDVAMPKQDASFTRTRSEALAELQANPFNRTAVAQWQPVRTGVSADGVQGFTMGVMTLRAPQGEIRRAKYLAYWRKTADGWRVVSYKRQGQEGDMAKAQLPPVLPAAAVPPITSAAAIARHRQSIDAAERAFSDEAQTIGLGPAFCKHGRADATNLGGPKSGMLIGLDKICRTIGGPPPSPVTWAPEAVEVASSGDLGVTWGLIRVKAPGDGPAAVPYTTVWVRSGPDQPWRYIAE